MKNSSLITKTPYVWWRGTMYDDVTLYIYYVWWCDAIYIAKTPYVWYNKDILCMLTWHCVWWCDTMFDDVWWCDTMFDDVTLCLMWHYVRCGTMYDDVALCMMMWHHVWWCDTRHELLANNKDTLCMMTWHYVWWCDTMFDGVTLVTNKDKTPLWKLHKKGSLRGLRAPWVA